jgi:hypothetical protein
MAETKYQIDIAFKKANKLVYASSMTALNRTAYKIAKEELPKVMEKIFDRPTKWITRGVQYVKEDSRTKSVKVLLPDWVPKGIASGKVLAAQIFGGTRVIKASEVKMRAAGILPHNMFIAPGSAMRLNAQGNIPHSEMIRIMSALDVWRGAGMSSGFDAGQTSQSIKRNKKSYTDLFVVNRHGKGFSKLPLGIYRRNNEQHTARQLLIFIKQPYYKVRFKFFEESAHLFDTLFVQEFRKAFDEFSKRN